MSRKKSTAKIQQVLRALMLADPHLSNVEIQRQTGASTRTVTYARASLRREGLLPDSRKSTQNPENLPTETLSPEDLKRLEKAENIDDELGDDDQIRLKIVRSVQRMALNPKLAPDTRLSASQIWVKLKDVSKEEELGPGAPRTEAEVIDRLLRIFEAVGHRTVLKALEMFTKKELLDENSENQQTPAASGASQDFN